MSLTTPDTIPNPRSCNLSQPIKLSPYNAFNTSQTVLVVIDSGVDQWANLASGIVKGAGVAILTADQDGITQITALLQACPSVTSLHIVSHGEPSTLYLGNTQLSPETIDRHSWDLQSWFSHLSTTPSLFFYGCRIAHGESGTKFLSKLHQLTGATINASTRPMGNGHWRFDTLIAAKTAAEEVVLPFNAETLANYQFTLAAGELDLVMA
ncbi:MAG TPA: DUF4347 domain-containing protein [Coleofasciculaceae cyanobacterium]|jgi:hypothetical protein